MDELVKNLAEIYKDYAEYVKEMQESDIKPDSFTEWIIAIAKDIDY